MNHTPGGVYKAPHFLKTIITFFSPVLKLFSLKTTNPSLYRSISMKVGSKCLPSRLPAFEKIELSILTLKEMLGVLFTTRDI